MLKAQLPEVQVRAHYRLGVINQSEESWAPSLVNLNKVVGLDPEFYRSQVNLRIAEVNYKLGDVDAAIKTLVLVEPYLRSTEKYDLHFIKGKCYDKQRLFKRAVMEYGQALEVAKENNMEQ